MWLLIFDLDLGTKEKILPQGINLWNIKAPSLNIQKLWHMFSYFADKQTEQNLYAQDLSMSEA